VGPRSSRLPREIGQREPLLRKFAFELVIVFVGVTGAFALENWREASEEVRYRQAMLGGLRASFVDYETHGVDIDRHLAAILRQFDASYRQGKMPPLPIWRETGGERPPTRAWDGIVATGATRSLDPTLFFNLARFYDRAASFGDRYIRYNQFSEERVLPYLGDQTVFYGPGRRLKPEYAAYVDRLRDLRRENHALVVEATALHRSLPR
jgi:hypothetical protein